MPAEDQIKVCLNRHSLALDRLKEALRPIVNETILDQVQDHMNMADAVGINLYGTPMKPRKFNSDALGEVAWALDMLRRGEKKDAETMLKRALKRETM